MQAEIRQGEKKGKKLQICCNRIQILTRKSKEQNT